MPYAYTTDEFLTQVKVRCQLPASGGALSDQEILDLATEEMWLRLVPLVRDANEEHWLKSSDTSITNGTAEYTIPRDSQVAGLRNVYWVDSGGNEYPMQPVPEDDRWRFEDGVWSHYTNGPFYTVTGNSIVVLPTPQNGGSLRFRYYYRLPRLVPVSEAMAITSISSKTLAGTTPSAFSVSETYDLIQADPHFTILADDQAVTSAMGGVTLVNDPPASLAVGDYVALTGQTPVVPLVVELHTLLIALAAHVVLESIGDRDAAAVEAERVSRLEERMIRLITPRVEGKSPRVIAWSSPLRQRRRARWGY